MNWNELYKQTEFAKWILPRQTVFDNIFAAKEAGYTDVSVGGLLDEGIFRLFHLTASGKYETGVKRIGLHPFLGTKVEQETNRLYFGFSAEVVKRLFRNHLLLGNTKYKRYIIYSIELTKISPGILFFRDQKLQNRCVYTYHSFSPDVIEQEDVIYGNEMY